MVVAMAAACYGSEYNEFSFKYFASCKFVKYKIITCIFFINLCSCTVHLHCLALRQAYRVVYKAIIVSLVLCFVGLEN